LGKSDLIWANLIRFEQNQNLASPKTFDLFTAVERTVFSLFIYVMKIILMENCQVVNQ